MHKSPGEGTIYRRKDGRWCAALQLGGRRCYVYGKSRKEAAEKLHRLTEVAQQNGRLPVTTKATLADFLTNWLGYAENHVRPTTLADYQVIVRLHIIPNIGNTKLSKVTPLQLTQFYKSLAGSLSPRRVGMVHELLHKALADAVKWGLLAISPAALVDAPKRQRWEKTLWTPEQIQTFATAMLNSQGGAYSELLLFLLASGCRIGEALGLRWSDVDWQRGTVRIERQIVQIGDKFVEGPPKTKAGIRSVTLPSFALEALRAHRARADSIRVFVSKVGTIPSRNNVRRSLRSVCERLGLPMIRPHDLRHLHLSLLAMNGVPVKVAQQRAGHSSARITLEIYQHVLGDGDRMAAEALSKILGAQGSAKGNVSSDGKSP